jgi:hypothetical protein
MAIPTPGTDTLLHLAEIHKEACALYDRAEYAEAHKLWQRSLKEAMQTIGHLQAELRMLKSERGDR